MARLLLFVALLWSSPTPAAKHITGIDISPWRAVIQTDGKVRYRWFRLSHPERLVIDLEDTVLERKRLLVPVGVGPVVRVRSAAREEGARRVVLDLRHALNPTLRQERGPGGWRIVVEFADAERSAPPPARPRPASHQTGVCPRAFRKGPFLVALDPGHGGRDGGASGPGGQTEKTVVLGIARHLHGLIARSPYMESILTREGDAFLELEERNRIAEACGADLLVSIHADSLPGSALRGASVYVNDHANRVAERLLVADHPSGARLTPVSFRGAGAGRPADRSPRVMRHLASVGAARLMLTELGDIGPLVRSSVLGGRFVVLQAAVPSVLVETGYISHREEERALADPVHQRRIAEALYRALVRHVQLVAGREGLERVHIVGRRTSVPRLAGRMGIDVEIVRQGMGTPGNVLSAGDVVRIPAGFEHS